MLVVTFCSVFPSLSFQCYDEHKKKLSIILVMGVRLPSPWFTLANSSIHKRRCTIVLDLLHSFKAFNCSQYREVLRVGMTWYMLCSWNSASGLSGKSIVSLLVQFDKKKKATTDLVNILSFKQILWNQN